MATSIASGLGSSFGFTTESAVGTFTTSSMRWLKVNKDTFGLVKTTGQSLGLHQGLFMEGKRRNLIQREATGQVQIDLQDKQLGLIFKHMLGAATAATQIGTTAAYQTIATPADLTGLSASIQVGKPFTSGTIQQFNYNGCKVLDWTISIQRGQLATLDLTFDTRHPRETLSLCGKCNRSPDEACPYHPNACPRTTA